MSSHHSVKTQSKLASLLDPGSRILDVGAGWDEPHAIFFRGLGHHVDTVDFHKKATHRGDFLEIDFDRQYDALWASHVLEHMPNVGAALAKFKATVRLGGWLAITVPPLKHDIVGGHVSLWNAGLLLYNLVLSGLDCSAAMVRSYDYNISIIVGNHPVNLPRLVHDNGDLETLESLFPVGLLKEARASGFKQGFGGVITDRNWE